MNNLDDNIKKLKRHLSVIKEKGVKNNIHGKKIVIGMGAGTISSWMREMPKFL